MSLEFKRLADRILYALQLALEQDDLEIAEILGHALEKALTRMAGGADFVERRDFDDQCASAMQALSDLRARS